MSQNPRFSLLSKERTFVGPGYNRWLVPPAALAVHLCIGMAYGFSVFWLPLSHALGITKAIKCPEGMGFFQTLFTTTCDWEISMLGWMYTLFFVFLGSSAAIFGSWMEHNGPRKAGFVAACCWGGGLLISALGVYLHQIWMLWLGSGVIGGIGLGLGYISPVSTLIKWFPDKRGMATGMAIMGFGGGAMIGAPFANLLMNYFKSPTSVGVTETFVVMGILYFVFMMGGAFGYRLPVPGWTPEGWTPPAPAQNAMITSKHVHLNTAIKTPQFWLIWWVYCLNITAGIGIIGMASPMLQEIFAGKLIGLKLTFDELHIDQKTKIATIAAGFTGLISLFNIGGRILWASFSDYIGRKRTYFIFCALGALLYASTNLSSSLGNVSLFVAAICIILSMYGGVSASLPAYLADIFGTQMVGAIHGRLLTGWSAAGIFGPVIVNYLREYELTHGLAHGMPRAEAYTTTIYVLTGLLVIAFICNLMIKPVDEKHYMTEEELEKEHKVAHETALDFSKLHTKPSSRILLVLAWLVVGLPLVWGIWITLESAFVLFSR